MLGFKNQMRPPYRLANGRRDGKDENRIWRKRARTIPAELLVEKA